MASSVRISRRCAQTILDAWEHSNHKDGWWYDELRAALAPRPKKTLSFVPRKKAKAAKKRTKKEETAEIRLAIMERAGGRCEGCREPTHPTNLEMDHMFGRVRVRQNERNCWALCFICHREKTRNVPSAAHWLNAFIAHAERYGFSEEAGMATRLLAKHETKAEFAKGASSHG